MMMMDAPRYVKKSSNPFEDMDDDNYSINDPEIEAICNYYQSEL